MMENIIHRDIRQFLLEIVFLDSGYHDSIFFKKIIKRTNPFFVANSI